MAFQSIIFVLGQLKQKVYRKALDISFDLTIHLTDFNLIHGGKISVQNDLDTTDLNNQTFNSHL